MKHSRWSEDVVCVCEYFGTKSNTFLNEFPCYISDSAYILLSLNLSVYIDVYLSHPLKKRKEKITLKPFIFSTDSIAILPLMVFQKALPQFDVHSQLYQTDI